MSYELSILYQLTSGFFSETALKEEHLTNPKVVEAIKKYNWIVKPSHINGWVDLIRKVNYSS